jgi:5-methylthioadenosine/S-adenosylhomocysteine deaminase
MENGVIPGLDIDDLRDQAQRSGEAIWSTLPDWDPRGRTAEEASPWSFPLHSC